MDLKYGIQYIATTNSCDGEIKEGESLILNYDKNDLVGDYSIFTKPRNTQPTFYGIKALNYVRYFKTENEMINALDGIKLEYNHDIANRLISNKQDEIEKIKLNYEI